MPNRSWSENIGRLLNGGRKCVSVLWLLEARLKGCSLGNGVKCSGRPLISVVRGSRLIIGDGASINSALRSNPLGCFQPSVLRTLSPQSELVLEPYVGISAVSIRIGQGSILGSGAMILDNDFHHPIENFAWGCDPARGARPVLIGKGVFIGARAIVLKGVTIGDRAIVGAGAVVTCDVPAGHLAVGNPAQVKPLRSTTPAE